MHIENESAEIVTISDHEYEEIVEEYEEEILVQEEVRKPPLTDAADTASAQGKPRCIILILLITVFIYLLCIYVAGNVMETTCIYICVYIHTPTSLTSTG
jgi:uncharacterized membrane protein (DUF106 family)